MTYSRSDIDAFLAEKRIAMIGVSRKPHHFSRALLREFLHRGYEIVPVHPEADRIEGLDCVSTIAAVQPPPGAALILTSRQHSAEVLAACRQAGVKRVWVYSGLPASEAPETPTITGECPFMFLPNSGWIHGVHRIIRRISGTLPA